MTKHALSFALVLLLPLLITACGGEEATEDPVPTPVGGGTGPIDATLSPDALTLREWEWYSASRNRITWILGRAVDETGRPLGGAMATVLIPPPLPMAPAREDRSVRADEDGMFRIVDVPRNAWIRVSAEGVADWIVKAPTLLRVGGEPVEVELRAPGEIRGRVTERDGTPAVGVDLMISGQGPRFATIATTDDEGRFHVPAAAPIEMSAWVMAEGFVGRSGAFRVRSGETSEVEVIVGRPAPITLEVKDEATGRPLSGVIGSTLFVEERNIPADAEGRLIVEGACFPRIWLRGDGFEETPIELPGDRTVPATFPAKLAKGARIAGRVTDPAGEPVENARTRVLFRVEDPGLPVRGPLTGPEGTFEISWIHAGEPTVCAAFAEKPGWYLKSAAVVPIRDGRATAEAVVVLDRIQQAKLRVLGPDGAPVTGALVSIAGVQSFRAGAFETFTTRSSGLTEADGRVLFYGVAPQRMEISVQAPGRVEHHAIRDVEPAEVFDLGDLRLPAGLSVAGRVRSTSGTVPPGTKLFVSNQNFRLEIDVASDGAFRCSGLPEGAVNLRVKAPGHEILNASATAGDTELDLVATALGSIRVKVGWPEEPEMRGWLELRPIGGSVHNRAPIVRQLEGRVEAWKFPSLLAGTYRIRIYAGDWYARKELKLGHGDALEVDMDLARGVTVRGVLLRPDRTPAIETGLKLVAGVPSDRHSRVTDGFGRFEFRGVPPGEVTLSSHPTGFAATSRTAKAVAGEPTEVEMVLRAGGRLTVSVRSESGAALAGVRVALSAGDAPARFWVEGGGPAATNDAGTVVLTGLSAGDYDLSLFRSDVRRPWGKVSVAEGGTARVDVVWK
ncbi:MAG: carboxypeptidase-like regulatory domain-containing protein [Planctomycetota bacterium]